LAGRLFDCIDHNILVLKLLSLGVRRSIILWICNFLSNRRQSVKIDNSQSEWGFVNAGVPQGISTWTYSFINDLELTSPNTNHWKYVDDVTISEAVNRNEISTLQSYLDAIETWTKNNNMKLNGIKCKEMIIRFLHSKTAIPGLCINELSLELVDSFKVLGVTINNKLKWQDNTVAIVKKAYLCYSCSATLWSSSQRPLTGLSFFSAVNLGICLPCLAHCATKVFIGQN
jgi:hypothetical protein